MSTNTFQPMLTDYSYSAVCGLFGEGVGVMEGSLVTLQCRGTPFNLLTH